MSDYLPNIPTHWLYPDSLEQASQVQRLLAEKVVATDTLFHVERIGGVDVSNNLYDPEKRIYAAVVSLDAQRLSVEETTGVSETAKFPYVPGFLAFREAPALVHAYLQLNTLPDVLLVDGHGISHPRGLGIASHLGVLLDIPSVGVAKSILVGHPEGELGPNPGDAVPLVWKGMEIAVALRTKARVKPVYVSVGHKLSLETAINLVMESVKGYRLPEPTRQAHLAANVLRRAHTPAR